MIDWNKTKQKFGLTESIVTSKSLVVVVCDECKSERVIKYVGHKTIIKAHGNSLCSSCRSKSIRVIHAEAFTKSDVKRAETLSRTYKKKWQDKKYRKTQHEIRNNDYRSKISNASKQCWQNDDYRHKVVHGINEKWNDQEYHQKFIEIMNSDEVKKKLMDNWKNHKYRDKVLAIWDDEDVVKEFAKRMSLHSKRMWSDPELRSKMIASLKKRWESLELREHASNVNKEIFSTPEMRIKLSKNAQDKAADPEWHKNVSDGVKRAFASDPDMKQKMSSRSKKLWQNEDYREKMAVVQANHPVISSLARKFYAMLTQMNIKYVEEGPETKFGPWTFDCLIPKQGNMQKHLLVEVHGEYPHSREDTKIRDAAKATYANRYLLDYELKVVWEQWFLFRNKVEDMVREWIGIKENTTLVDFSLNDVKTIESSYKECLDFLSRHHYLYTCPRGSTYYKAVINDEIVAVCLYSPLIRQNIGIKNCLELSRFCVHPSYQKKNFASWLISRTNRLLKMDKPETETIITYADSTVGHVGTIYKAANFKLDHIVEPDYWYVDKDGYVVHKRTLYARACKMSQKERDYAENHGYKKVWGGEKRRYSINL
jgi:GNAT superfamily N-acetyltransferase